MSEEIKYGPYGEFDLRIGGELRTLRFKYTAIKYLEKEMGMSVTSMLTNPEALGMTFCVAAVTAGVMHEFVGKKGKRKEILTEDLVGKWVQECYDVDDLEFSDLLSALVKGIVCSLPGGAKMMEDADGDDSDEDAVEGND